MADPTKNLLTSSFSVAPCPKAYATKSAASIGSAQSTRRDFFNSIGKIGDLEILNSVGGGAIGQGLRTLTQASNSIRTGCGALPSFIGDSIDQGANWVLDQMGIASTAITSLMPFHPEIANAAYGNAKAIYERIQQGHFKSTDIPSYLQEFQNLERLIRGIYVPGNDRLNSLTPRCEASPYAIDLLSRAPKFKFLFVVQFKLLSNFSHLQDKLNGMAFVVKKSTKPNIKYVTEDVNYYNFRSKVITKTEFDEMSITFHDDNLNNTHEFYSAYIKAMSPILNTPNWKNPDMLEAEGMNFPTKNSKESNYSASLGTVAGDSKQQVFREITLYHMFDWGKQANIYHFYNPRLSQLQLDDLDMSENSTSELSMNFNYDYVYVETVDASSIQWEDMQVGAVYPLRYNTDATSRPSNNIGQSTSPSSAPSCGGLPTTNTSSYPVGPFNGGFGSGF